MNILSAWFQAGSGAVLLQQASLRTQHRQILSQKHSQRQGKRAPGDRPGSVPQEAGELPLALAAVFTGDGAEESEAQKRLGVWFQTRFTEQIRAARDEEDRAGALGESYRELEELLQGFPRLSCAGILGAGEVLAMLPGEEDSGPGVYRLANVFGRRRFLLCRATQAGESSLLRAEVGTSILLGPRHWEREIGAERIAECLGGALGGGEAGMERRLRELCEAARGAAVLLTWRE